MGATVATESQPRDDRDLPVFVDPTAVPRDLRTARELAAGGYYRLGPVVAWLQTPTVGEPADLRRSPPATNPQGGACHVGLHSTSEARRLKGFAWSWPQRGAASPGGRPPAGDRRPRSSRPADATTDRPVLERHTPLVSRLKRRPTLGQEPRRWLTQLFREGFVVIDTETTGLSARDEIIEVAAVSADGAVIFESLVRPKSGHVPAASTRIHGLSFRDVASAPTWPEVVDQLFEVVAGHRLFAWNASFDERLSVQSSRAWRVPHPLPGFECAMRAYAACRGVGSGSLRLERAASVEGVLVAGQSHRSAADARLTLAVLNCLRRSSASA